MASLIYNSFWDDVSRALLDVDGSTFKMMLVTSGYVPDKDTHTKRSDVTNEVAATGNYTAGGQTVACTVTKDTTNDRIVFTFAETTWADSTITARGAVIYQNVGSTSTDRLVAYNDFGVNVNSTAASFIVQQGTITLQN
jgi:hypothetical protein